MKAFTELISGLCRGLNALYKYLQRLIVLRMNAMDIYRHYDGQVQSGCTLYSVYVGAGE